MDPSIKVHYRYPKLREICQQVISKLFRMSNFETFFKTFPEGSASERDVQVIEHFYRELLKHSIQTSIAKIDEVNEKMKVSSYLQMTDILAMRRSIYKDMQVKENWTEEFDPQLLFLQAVRDTIKERVQALDQDEKMWG